MDNDYKNELGELVSLALREGASDIHISVGRKPAMRTSGKLVFFLKKEPTTEEAMQGILKEMLGEEGFNIFRKKREADFSYTFLDNVRLRGNAFVSQGKMSLALRVIPKVKTLDELGLPKELKTLAMKEQGFFLVVGPVGQGKSTTMSAMIEEINMEKTKHIVTVEDPIEYVFEPKKSIIDQREVGIDTENFEQALKSAFRQDANVLMIGEMRNPGTIANAVTAAETGHLVFSTLHTNNASQTIDRIVDSFPGESGHQVRISLAGSLLGIFSQRLIPKISGGLAVAYELMINTTAVSNLIREGRTKEIDVLIETGTEQGMIDINRCLLDLVRQGEITMENAYAYSLNPKALERLS